MAFDLSKIRTVVYVMMENRSFDQMLGYLRLPPSNLGGVDGLQSDPGWNDLFANLLDKVPHQPYLDDNPLANLANDPPHDRSSIAKALDPQDNGDYPMTGFVQSFADYYDDDVKDAGMVMAYYAAAQLPMTAFLAGNFAICDRWFSSIPASTQPNRLMAMAGYTKIENNQPMYDPLLPDHDLVYDWLTNQGIRWRVYHEGLPFFSMMSRWWPHVVDNELFRPFNQFRDDILNAGDDFPQVIFLEPTYTDAPHTGNSSDDHAPSAIHYGQEFLSKAYEAVTVNTDIWAETVMVITYDEHGGFFDHVKPPAVVTNPPRPDAYNRFETLGVRVPGFIVSPFVSRGTICHEQLDHTSVLKFIAELFGKGQGYLPPVDQRDVRSVSTVLNLDTAREDVPAPPSLVAYLQTAPTQPIGFKPGTTPTTPIQAGFKAALDGMRDMHNEKTTQKFGSLMDNFPKSPMPPGVPAS